jgi:hypothetical protein
MMSEIRGDDLVKWAESRSDQPTATGPESVRRLPFLSSHTFVVKKAN